MFKVDNKDTRMTSGVFIVNFEHTLHLVLVLLLWTLGMYLFAVSDLFYNSINLDWSFQVSSIYRKDFHEVEYFDEVECTGGG